MKRILFVVLAFVLTAFTAGAASTSDADPRASEQAVVVAGNARFTVLTPQLIRMEWSEDGVFEDRASLTFINRNLPVPEFKVKKSGKKVTVKTSAVTLTYVDGNGPFNASNLKVEFLTAGKKTVWAPGMDDSANLMGTTRTLDNVDGRLHTTKDPLEKGLLSRDGWAIVDDSKNYLMDETGWVTARPGQENYLDWYIFAYGHEYKLALSDYSKVSGPAPLPPRYTFGYWYSRYWQYSDSELRDIIERFRSIDIPVDVLIIDMDWHETWGLDKDPELDEYGQRIGWTGYTWQKELFPNPKNFLGELHRRNIKSSLNLHFDNGVQPYEEPYERFVKDYTSRTSDYDGPKDYVYTEPYTYKGNDYTVGKAGEKAPVPFRMSQIEWADAFFNSITQKEKDNYKALLLDSNNECAFGPNRDEMLLKLN